ELFRPSTVNEVRAHRPVAGDGEMRGHVAVVDRGQDVEGAVRSLLRDEVAHPRDYLRARVEMKIFAELGGVARAVNGHEALRIPEVRDGRGRTAIAQAAEFVRELVGQGDRGVDAPYNDLPPLSARRAPDRRREAEHTLPDEVRPAAPANERGGLDGTP